ncbi:MULTISPECIES: type II toxin-antitoxin system ParD family antitoxin [unclassified Agrobacterium]|uniref:type II toxin-antitoxin system ParD family antitoxin n=1 Tax=unclassified Agrobacterium TaxID=2632611 RepID=UPI00244B7CCE|nr:MULTISPECIES: type II toxin-antitoxin system ParD family antitoxin [unclassified Agrobacterium]MDH0613216.1 type II toxin-antitoxin system ParD family antitoxin [Agrobacterium sp. GD03872]MDH0695081.1 type II toxin-antitoxin system ParD family antitoxin [Agrobacterium sp. GD03871]MDH1057521.1 type II toxin-antitoxin system ParD family antitoxin [Agrobacterium sp. GD03992]MDH2208810.1 type II toxin-antitoxin system ParD family antitoxin [Agrobacterium sp. GD03643]MDH2218301.1 type II toxin-a
MASSANLGRHLESYVSDLVKSGRYNSRSEVLREGVRLVEEREKRLAALDLAIARGIADADAGRTTPVDDVASQLSAKYRKMAEERGL